MREKKHIFQNIMFSIWNWNFANPVIVLISICMIFIFLAGHTIIASGRMQEQKEIRVKYYTSIKIQKGDTLWSIAEEYMSQEYESTQEYIDELIRINNLSSYEIHYGKFLMVPYYDFGKNK